MLDHHLRLPAAQTENREGSDRESGRFRAFRLATTRSTGGRNPVWRGDFRQEKGPGDFPSPCVWWSWRELNPRPQAFVRQIYMFSGLIWISLPMSRSRTLHGPPAPYFLASTQGTRMEASPCNYPCSREAQIAQNPLAQPIGQLLQGSLAIKQRVRNVRRLQLVC